MGGSKIDRIEKNFLINGNFDYWQRIVANDVRTGVGGAPYGADRWKVFPSSATNNAAHMQRAASTNVGSKYDMNFGPFGANEKMGVAQILENLATLRLRTKTVTFAVYLKSGVASNLRLQLLSWTGTADAPTGFSNVIPYTDWTTYALAAGFTSLATKTLTTTTGYVKHEVSAVVPANCNNLICIMSYDQNAGQQHYASQAMLVVGSVSPTEFCYAGRDVLDELPLCQRYYEKSYGINIVPGSSDLEGAEALSITGNIANLGSLMKLPYKTRKRASAAVAVWSATGQVNRLSDGNLSDLANGTVFPGSNYETGARVSNQSGATITPPAFNTAYFHWVAEAEL